MLVTIVLIALLSYLFYVCLTLRLSLLPTRKQNYAFLIQFNVQVIRENKILTINVPSNLSLKLPLFNIYCILLVTKL
jgi:hypothetical protein